MTAIQQDSNKDQQRGNGSRQASNAIECDPNESLKALAGDSLAHDIGCDVVIVGCGVAGLYAALNLPRALHVVMICKEDLASCDSMLAQGGICVMRDHDDYDSWFDDTMRAGHYENRKSSVDTMI